MSLECADNTEGGPPSPQLGPPPTASSFDDERLGLAAPWDQLLTSTKTVDEIELASVKQSLWTKYKSYFTCNAKENVCSKNSICEKMKIGYSVIGDKPPQGYPLYICLHGGGGTLPPINDSQWHDMQGYYRDSVSAGVYVAPRGITDTWNLHFVKESYELYDKLITYMILCHDVDPNRVYLLGFSAGGDGVYQITPRMADRWAAANMSSGHPNGVRMINLYHVPFLIQVGEHDTAYNRCQVGAEYGGKLDELQERHPDGYLHDCWVHQNKGHNFKDNDENQQASPVICDLKAWLEKNSGQCQSVERDTNAIAWVSQHRRNPIPSHLIWDVSTRASRTPLYNCKGVTAPSDLFYWIDIGRQKGEKCDATLIEVCVDRDSNSVHVVSESECGTWVRILISDRMLHTRKEVKIIVGVHEFKVTLYSSLATMVRTLLERGDPNFMFESEIVLSKGASEQWDISGTF